MKYRSIWALAALVATVTLALSSCRENGIGCIRGTGTTITETREVDDFSELEIQTNATIKVVEDTVFSFTATGQENILQNLLVSIRNGKLVLRDRRCVRGTSRLTIEIHAPLIQGVSINGSSRTTVIKNNPLKLGTVDYKVNGSGKITLFGMLKADEVRATINGSGDIEIPMESYRCFMNITGSGHIITEGTATYSDIDIDGSGNAESYNLQTVDTKVDITGSGRADVNVSDELDVNISGSGSVHYKGWPRLSTRISGSGKVVHED